MTDMKGMKGRILLVEPRPELAKNLNALISKVKGFRIVGQSCYGLDAMRKTAALAPDILILDLALPDIGGLEMMQWVEKLFPDTKVVLLSAHDLPEYRLAATRLKASFVSKADLYRKLPQALARLRRQQEAREREQGGLLLDWAKGLRRLARWISGAAEARKQAPMWQLIHAAVGLVSLELIGVALWRSDEPPGLILAGWTLLLAALVHDFYTLRTSLGSKAAVRSTVH